MSYLSFESKDMAIMRHYERTFGEAFTAEMLEAKTPEDVRECLRSWNERMLAEANKQQHYDYTVDDQGKRHLIYVDGIPKLLIPEVRIVPS